MSGRTMHVFFSLIFWPWGESVESMLFRLLEYWFLLSLG